jgi:hypothetical protein
MAGSQGQPQQSLQIATQQLHQLTYLQQQQIQQLQQVVQAVSYQLQQLQQLAQVVPQQIQQLLQQFQGQQTPFGAGMPGMGVPYAGSGAGWVGPPTFSPQPGQVM